MKGKLLGYLLQKNITVFYKNFIAIIMLLTFYFFYLIVLLDGHDANHYLQLMITHQTDKNLLLNLEQVKWYYSDVDKVSTGGLAIRTLIFFVLIFKFLEKINVL